MRGGRHRLRALVCGLWGLATAWLPAGCATKQPSVAMDPTLAQLASSAQAAFEIGAIERAARFFELALGRARAMDDSAEIGRNAYNLAACLMIAGEQDRVEPLLREARAEFTRSRQNVAPVLVLEARHARTTGRPDEALALASEAMAAANSPGIKAQAHLLLTDIAADQGDVDRAGKHLRAARTLLDEADDRSLRALVAETTGRVQLLRGEPAKAAAEHDRAAHQWQRAGRYREMARALERAGAAHAEAGANGKAADRFYRSARSLHMQGETVGSLKAIEQATLAAEKQPDETLARLIAELFAEVSKSVATSDRADAVTK